MSIHMKSSRRRTFEGGCYLLKRSRVGLGQNNRQRNENDIVRGNIDMNDNVRDDNVKIRTEVHVSACDANSAAVNVTLDDSSSSLEPHFIDDRCSDVYGETANHHQIPAVVNDHRNVTNIEKSSVNYGHDTSIHSDHTATNRKMKQKQRHLVGWDDILCRPIYTWVDVSSDAQINDNIPIDYSYSSNDTDISEECEENDEVTDVGNGMNFNDLRDEPVSFGNRMLRQRRSYAQKRSVVAMSMEMATPADTYDYDEMHLDTANEDDAALAKSEDELLSCNQDMNKYKGEKENCMIIDSGYDIPKKAHRLKVQPSRRRRALGKQVHANTSKAFFDNEFEFLETGQSQTARIRSIMQPSSQTSLEDAEAFFEYLDKNCPLVLSTKADEMSPNVRKAKRK